MDDSDLYRLFKTLHVISAFALGGGFVLEGICGPLVARARSVQEVRAFARLMFISENYLSIPAAIAIFVLGMATADRGNISFDETWLSFGMTLFFVIVILALLVLRPAANRLHRLAEATPDGPVTPELTAQLKNPLLPIVGTLTSIAFVFIIYLMVARPGW
jgi:uncharacterized membrane protein